MDTFVEAVEDYEEDVPDKRKKFQSNVFPHL
jgi:hypothetical protein